MGADAYALKAVIWFKLMHRLISRCSIRMRRYISTLKLIILKVRETLRIFNAP